MFDPAAKSLWSLPLLLFYSMRALKSGDFDINQHNDAAKLGDELENFWNEQQHYSKDPSLAGALIKVFAVQFMLLGIFLFISEFGFVVGITILLRLLLNSCSENSKYYVYGGVIIVFIVVKQSGQHYYLLNCAYLEIKAQMACCSLVYRKALRMDERTLTREVLVKLMQPCFDLKYFQFVVVGGGASILSILVLYNLEGRPVLLSLAFYITIFCMQKYIEKMLTPVKTKLFPTNQSMKLETENQITSCAILPTDQAEIDQLISNAIRKILNLTSLILEKKICLAVSFLIFIANDSNLVLLYISFILFENTKTTVSILPSSWALLRKTLQSIQRFEEFLISEDLHKRQAPRGLSVIETLKKLTKRRRIIIRDGWVRFGPTPILRHINFKAKLKQLNVIIGDSGKSTLLQVIIGERDLTKGRLQIAGSISYAPQTPWIFPGSLRDNVLFNQDMNWERYESVLRVCNLREDLNLEDYAQVEEEEKAKVSLARAIYKEADIYVLDDPLLAVSSHSARLIYEECIADFLRKKCVILVSSQGFCLEKAQTIYLMQMGSIIARGNFKKLTKSFGQFVTSMPQKTSISHQLPAVELTESQKECPKPQIFSLLLVLVVVQVIISLVDNFHDVWSGNLRLLHFVMIFLLGVLAVIIIYVCNLDSTLIFLEKFANLPYDAINIFKSDRKGSLEMFVGRTVTGFGGAASITILFAFVNPWIVMASVMLWMSFFYLDVMIDSAQKKLDQTKIKRINRIESILSSTVKGLVTIRVFKAQQHLLNEFDKQQDQLASINRLKLDFQISTEFYMVACILFYMFLINFNRIFFYTGQNITFDVSQFLMVLLSIT